MIYLIDDKKLRQEKDFGWGSERLSIFKEFLTPIYNISELEKTASEIFTSGNTVLYHESFLDHSDLVKKALFKRERLEEFAQKHPSFNLVIFSGSKSSRVLKGNSAHLPVSIIYKNLDKFVQGAAGDDISLEYLAFGNNPHIESELLDKLESALANIEADAVQIEGQSNLFVTTVERNIQNPIEDATMVTLFDEESDADISEFIKNNLSATRFDNLFIPLCYGNSLSDYNGLRLASHIRCTSGSNQTSRIFIYGFVGLEYLLQNEYFNILRSSNVKLVGFSKQAFKDEAIDTTQSLTMDELPRQVAKLKLEPPKNYEDNHSVNNEWAIYQWSNSIGHTMTPELQYVFKNVQSNLYFKYLKTINPFSIAERIPENQLMIDKKGSPRVLLIDDESEKGWGEFFSYLLEDLNEIYFDYLGEGFKNLSRKQIVEQSLEKIINENIDVVILDFRLNLNDFAFENIEEVTGIQLLKEIKKINPGIQVIVFSATNKIWNLQAIQKSSADGFILKDIKQNYYQGIFDLIALLESRIEKALWLKPVWEKTNSSLAHIDAQRKNHIFDKDFAGAIRTFLELGFDSMMNEKSRFPFDSSFMYYFLILEASSKLLIDEENPIEENGEYKFQFRKNYEYLKFFNERNQMPSNNDLLARNRRIPYNQKFLNLINFANIHDVDPFELVKLRNSFNHPDLIENRRIAAIKKEHVNKIFEVCIKLINFF